MSCNSPSRSFFFHISNRIGFWLQLTFMSNAESVATHVESSPLLERQNHIFIPQLRKEIPRSDWAGSVKDGFSFFVAESRLISGIQASNISVLHQLAPRPWNASSDSENFGLVTSPPPPHLHKFANWDLGSGLNWSLAAKEETSEGFN